MRALLFTTGSPFARAVRIVLDELALDYERREEITTPSVEERVAATPTLQVPTFWDGDLTLWESGLIVEYLLSTYRQNGAAGLPLATHAFRPEFEWHDKLVFATIQTFGNAATTISQMRWSGIALQQNAHLQRSAEKLFRILNWLEGQLGDGDGFVPGYVSMQDIFLASHVRFVQARPLGIELGLESFARVSTLLERLDERESFKANPIWWWEPGVVAYEPDGTPIYKKDAGSR
ncbi:glutathione S-transferase family protein [Nitratireductor mangrovi]|uniref:Glutathione S-transferase family protein n=1 Tax=Nitratireductor mangrovi TaxID=2599600 RepID=A0A5B8L4E4_9HYPH|nr:glutathione S-transferase family protein [Nitratireductor mangrovi]QDZ02540.1 glutathione S-transferase family protein [Nitratireductor mangrovi]